MFLLHGDDGADTTQAHRQTSTSADGGGVGECVADSTDYCLVRPYIPVQLI